MIHTADAREVVWSLKPDKQFKLFSWTSLFLNLSDKGGMFYKPSRTK